MAIVPINETYEGFTGFVTYVNNASGGIMMPGLLLVVWVVTLVSQLQFTFIRAFITASLFCSIMAIPLVLLNMLAPMYMYALFVMVGLGILFYRIRTGGIFN